MAGKVTFILKDPRAKGETPIYAVYRYKSMRIKISTGERIRPDHWNPLTHRAREIRKFPEFDNLNTRIETIQSLINNTARDHLTQHQTIKPDTLRVELIDILRHKPSKEPEKMTFFKAIEEYIQTSNKKRRTKLSYGTTLNVLKKYETTKREPLTFDSINMDFYEDFTTYLEKNCRFTKNTVGDHIKKIKVFMNYSLDKGYTTNQGHRHRKFKTVEETADTIYLNDQELETIYNLDLTVNPRMERVRDLFLIGCYTGLRFSDLSQLTADKFIKDGTQIKIKTAKTGETVVIPLHWTIREILRKYNGELPRVISNQKMNEYLKELGQMAGFTEKINVSKTKGGLNFDKTSEKWELITVHTARRSFATNMYLAEVPAISIMKITGHRTERAFLKYIKITAEQNADRLAKHPYFAAAPLKIAK